MLQFHEIFKIFVKLQYFDEFFWTFHKIFFFVKLQHKKSILLTENSDILDRSFCFICCQVLPLFHINSYIKIPIHVTEKKVNELFSRKQ